MLETIDQLGRSLELNGVPQRIISVVPSQTELLFDLGLDKEVTGITKFCIHPNEWFRTKTRIGGTKKLNIEKIKSLNPDLIIANKEENSKEQVEELAKIFPVWTSDIKTIDDSISMIQSIGQMTGKENKANEIIEEIKTGFRHLSSLKKSEKKVAYLIWKDPYLTINHDTFIHHVLELSGYKNVFSDNEKRYPETTLEEIKSLNTDYIFLSSEPFPFKEKQKDEIEKTIEKSKIIFVDGEYFSWYGSRLIKSSEYLQNLMNSLV